MARFYREQRHSSTDTSAVNDAYIDAFYKDWNSFSSSAKNDFSSVGWGNASSSYESRNATWQELSKRADIIEAYYFKNRNNFKNADGYASMIGGLNDIRSGASDILKSFKAEADYYSNFATEDEFNEWNKYSHIPEASDFAEKSKYVSTYRGGENFSPITGTYIDTGFDDIMYDFINRNETAASRKGLDNIASGAAFLGFDNRERREMTDDEISIFNYIYSTQGKDAAYEYVDHITAGPVGLNARQRAKETEMWGNYAKESPVASSVFSVLEAPLKGLSYIGQTADYFSDGKIDQNAGYNKFSYINSAIRDQVTQDVEKNWGGVGSFAYQTGMSMADFLFTTAISGGNSALSLGIMGTGAAADTVIYAKDRGLSDNQAFALGTIAGAAEIVTEKISLDALLDATQLGKNALGYIAQNIIAEGTEEVTSSAINLIADVLISRDKSEWREAINAYKAAGMSDKEAFWHAVGDQALSLGLDFLGGAISGGVMGGGGATLGAINTTAQGFDLKRDGYEAGKLTGEYLKINPDNRYAQKMQGKLDSGKTLSNYQLGKLVQQNESELLSQDKVKIKSAVEARLTELGETENISKLADIVTKVAAGEQLTSSEKSALKKNQNTWQVLSELYPGNNDSDWTGNIGTNRINAEAYSRNIPVEAAETAVTTEAEQAEAAPVTENAPIKENAVEGEIKAPADVKQAVVSEAKQTETATMLDGEGNEVSVNPVKFAEIGDGEATLELEGGQTVKADSVAFKNSGVGFVYKAATEMASGGVGGFNVDAANVMVRGVSPDISEENASLYVAAFNEAYRYGAMGYPSSALESRWSTAFLSEKQRETAYSLGKIYGEGKVSAKQANIDRAKAESAGKPRKKGKVIFDGSAVGKTLTERQRASLKGLRVVAEATGVDIHVFESPVGKNGKREGANGWYDPVKKEIHIDLHAGIDGNGLMLMTGSHELTHHIKEVSPAKFKVFADALLEEYTKNGISVDGLVAKKIEQLEKNKRITHDMTDEQKYDLALEEVVADACESMLVDSGAIEALSRKLQAKDKGLWETIKDFITKLVARIRAAYAGVDPDSVEGKLLREMKDSAERLRELWVEALTDAADTMTATEQFSTDTLRGSANGAVIQSKVTEALTEIAEGEGVLYSLRTEFEAMPKQVMNLSSGEGTIIEHIEGLTPTEVKGLASVSTNGFTGRDVRGYAMRNGGFTKAQINHVNAFMDAMADLMEKAGVTYKFIGLQDVENAKLHYSYNPDGSIKSIVLSAMVKNGDYPVNFDLSSICKKRVAMSTLIDKLAKRGSLDNGTVKLTPANIFRINTALKDAGYETACLGCFVESKRYNSLQWAKTFCDKWNAAVKKVNPNATYFGYGDNTFSEDSFTVEQAIKIDNAATRYNASTKTERLANAIAKYKERAQAGLPLVEGKVMKIDGEELNTFSKAARDRLINSDLISDELKDKYLSCDVSTLTLEDVEVLLETGILSGARLSNKQSVTEMVKSGEVYQHLLKPSDLLTDRGISKLEALPNFHGVLYGHYGSGTPKLMQGYTPYNSEIALLPGSKGVGKNEQSLAEYLYTIAGVRMQSFSDFQIQNIYDYLQMVADLAARKVPAHAYTKEISFAKLLGMTGIKVNLSVMFDIDPMVDKAHAGLTKYNMLVHKGEYAKIVLEDAQGKWVYNIGDYQTQKMFDTAYPDESKRFLQSIGFSDAVKLQTSPGYSANCGIIGVGYSDLGIFAMLDDKRVRYIIPYHASSLPAEIKVATHIELGTDYTPYQNNMKIVGIVDRNGNKVEWTIKEAYKRLGSGQAVINELNGKVRDEGWVVTTKKAQTGHGTYGLYEDLKATGDPKQTASNFMDWCIGNGTLPLFYQFASHENYYKMLYDYNVYDCVTEEYAPQQAVTNTYPTMVDGKVQPGTVTDGGFDTAYLQGTIDKQMAFMDEYGKNLDKDLEKLSDNMEKGKYSLNEWRFSDRDSDILYSDRDTSYMEAVKRGDMKTAQKMVDEAAKKAGYTIKAYHGTSADFTVFDKDYLGSSTRGGAGTQYGFFFAEEESHAEYWAENASYNNGGNSRVISSYLQLQNPLVYDDSDFNDGGLTLSEKIEEAYYDGNDGIIVENVLDDDSGETRTMYVVFDPEKIKSSDPVTYDDSGNVIPLSERFNPKNDDIRYSDRDTDSYSNRSLLAGALETAVQNDIEKQRLAQYKQKIDLLNSEEQKLRDLRAQIKKLSFEKGPRDTEALKNLQFEANQTANRINVYDRQLLDLESTKALKGVLEREKKLAYQKAEQRGKEALEAQREREAKTRREMMDRYQASRQKAAEGRNKVAVRLKIKNVVNSLNSYLLSGSKEKHVPIGLQSAVAEALNAVNMDTVGAEKRIAEKEKEMMRAKTPEAIEEIVKEIEHIREMGGNLSAKLERLKVAYDDIINSDDPIVANSYDEVISNTISRVIKVVGDTSLRDMSLHQLEEVYDMYKMILATVRNTNKAFKLKKSEEISTVANRVIAELDGLKKRNHLQSGAAEAISSFDWNNQKPVYAFEKIGSGTFTDVFNSVREGEDVWARDMSEAKAFLEEQKGKYHFKDWDFGKKYAFASTTGLDFSLSLGQIISLYAFSKRGSQATEHLRYGGFVHDGLTEIKKKGKFGTVRTYKLKDSTAYNLSEGILDDIISKLTDEQKHFADAMQDYLSTVMGEKGNEVSLALYDVKLFKEKNYLPLKSAPQFLARAREQLNGDVKIKNKGFTKETKPKSRNPIVLSDFMDVWAGHVNEMSMYHAFALPLEDFYRVYNYNTPASETLQSDSVISYLENVHGNASVAYIDQLLKDLNGGARSDPREIPFKALTSNFKKAAVMASLSVVVQQPSAIVRAYALIDAKHFVGKKVSKAKQKETWAEVKKYAPVAIIKEMGYFDTGMGQSSADWLKGEKTWKDKVDDVLSFLPSKADEVTWCAIWNAVKRETASKNTELATSSEEFLRLAGERFTEVIVKTQVYDSTLAKSANMRSKNLYMNMLTAFMAEPTTSINMLQDAFRKGGKKRIARAMGAVYGSVLLNSVLVSLVYAARDDDEDETYLEKYLSRLVTEVVDGVNPLTYLPFVKDIWSIAQGFDVERADMTLIDSLIDSFKQLFTVCSKDTDDMDEEELGAHRESVAGAILSVVDNGASLLGIPEKNLRREIGGAINFIKTLANESGKMSAGSLGDNIVEDLKDSVPVWGWFPDKSKSDKLYDAIVKGDEKYSDRLMSGYKDQNAVNSALRKALRDNDPRIKEAAEARYNGDIAEYMKIAKEIISEGNFKQDDVVAAVNSEINEIKKRNGDVEESAPSDKVVSLYKVDDYFKAIMGGDSASAYAVKYDLIETSIANGKDRDEAEASFNSSLTSHIREKYETGDITEYEAKNMLSYAGKTAEEADSKIQYWSFQKQYPDYDLTESQVSKYYSDVKPSGISVSVYYDYSKQRAKAQGTDLNGDGKTDSGSVKREVMQIIHSLPISSYQKDALYYLNGWAASTIWEAPWH